MLSDVEMKSVSAASCVFYSNSRVYTFFRFALIWFVVHLCPSLALAQDIIPDTEEARDAFGLDLNSRRIGIVTGAPGGTYIHLGSDLSRLVQSATGGDIRVIVMEGRGSVGNLQDLVFLKYADLALVQADVLAKIAREDPDDYDFLRERIRLVARFHQEVIHVLIRGGSVETPAALDGKRVAIGAVGSGTQITAPIIFELLDIQPEYVPLHQEAAFADLLSESPTIDAMVYVSGRGSPLFARITPEMARRIQDSQIYFVPFPTPPPSESSYVTDSVSSDDYPSLIEQGSTVAVWAVPAVLAVYNWDPGLSETHRNRHELLATFVETFFDNRSNLNDGPGGYNENWCSIDLSTSVAGWGRFSAAQSWLDNNAGTAICEALSLSCQEVFAKEMREAGLDPVVPTVAVLFEDWRKRNTLACR